jgi:hypothetical protein
MILPNRTLADERQNDFFWTKVDTKKYKGTTQRELNTFLRQLPEVFDVRHITFSNDKIVRQPTSEEDPDK